MTTQIPHAVHIALGSRAEPPRRDYPPLRISWYSSPWWSKGIETHTLDGVPVRKYDPAKSVAETLKYHTGLRTCPRERVADIPPVQFGPLVHDLVTIWWPIDAGALISAEKPRRDER